MTRGMKQVAVAATLKLMGLAVLAEATSDYLAFRSLSIRTVEQAVQIAQEIEDQTGILIVIRG